MDQFRIDDHKMIYHPKEVAALLDAENNPDKMIDIFPLYVEVSPVGACNHRCTFCAVDYIGYPSHNKISLEVMQRMLDAMGQNGVKSIMYAGEGEPLLHKKINEIVAHTKRAGIDVAFTTNAVVLNQRFIEESIQHASWIKASVNAGSAENYAKIHVTKADDFGRVVENLKRAVEYRNQNGLDCAVGVQSLLLPENVDEMVALGKIVRDEIGADYFVVKPFSQRPDSLNTAYLDIHYRDQQFQQVGEEVKALERKGFNVSYRGKTMELYHEESEARYTTCYSAPLYMAYVMSDGAVYGCNEHLLDERFHFGNINETDFEQIWRSERRRKCIDFVLNELDVKQCRVNCRMDKVNRYLADLKEARIKHVNFI